MKLVPMLCVGAMLSAIILFILLELVKDLNSLIGLRIEKSLPLVLCVQQSGSWGALPDFTPCRMYLGWFPQQDDRFYRGETGGVPAKSCCYSNWRNRL